MIYTAKDLDIKARHTACAADKRATRISWRIDVGPSRHDRDGEQPHFPVFVVTYRAGGEDHTHTDYL